MPDHSEDLWDGRGSLERIADALEELVQLKRFELRGPDQLGIPDEHMEHWNAMMEGEVIWVRKDQHQVLLDSFLAISRNTGREFEFGADNRRPDSYWFRRQEEESQPAPVHPFDKGRG